MRRTRQRGPSNLTAGLVLVLVVVIGCFFAFTKRVPFQPHFEVDVAFRSVNGLAKGSQVRMAGVTIGKVVGSKAAPGDARAALVRLRIDDKGLPLHADARFKIRPRLFLEGNFFVDVQPGTPARGRLEDGDVVPVSQSSTPVQFDQLLSALESDTREDLKVLLDEYGTAIDRGAGAVNRTFRYTRRANRYSAEVADAQLGSRPGGLGRLVRDSGKVSAAIGSDPAALQDLIVGLYSTARGFASEGDRLDASLRELPRTLRVASPALASLNRAFPPLRSFAADLRPAVRSSVPALDATLPLARQLRALVRPNELQGLARTLRAAAPDLVEAERTSIPGAEETRQASSCLNKILVPWSQEIVPDQQFPVKIPIFKEATRLLTGLAGESRSVDANNTWFRSALSSATASYLVGNGEILSVGSPLVGINPPAPKADPPLEPGVACETQERPDLRSRPASAPQRISTPMSTPAVRERLAGVQGAAVDWLRQQLADEKLTKKIQVTDVPLTESQAKELGR